MFEIGKIGRLTLGYTNENKARVIDVDMTGWIEDFPDGNIGLLVKRPLEDTFYPADIKRAGNVIIWVPGRSDLEIDGEGEAQFVLTNEEGVELRSRVVKTRITASLEGTEGDAPGPADSFVQTVINSAAKAEAAVEKMPSIGENGNWHAWDAEAGAYVDTGKPSRGVQGEQGPKSDKGEAGPVGPAGATGATGPKGDKGDTGATGETGPAGPTGSQGPKGDKGDTGPVGPQGPAGKDGTGVTILGSYETAEELAAAHPTGTPGDAYLISGDLYVWSATENTWVNAGRLQGEQGPQGEKGDKGDKGDTGTEGPQGPEGQKGDKGDTGDTGPKGPKGDKGDTGPAGANGYTPVKGTDYWTTADRQSMVNDVIAALPVYNGEVSAV